MLFLVGACLHFYGDKNSAFSFHVDSHRIDILCVTGGICCSVASIVSSSTKTHNNTRRDSFRPEQQSTCTDASGSNQGNLLKLWYSCLPGSGACCAILLMRQVFVLARLARALCVEELFGKKLEQVIEITLIYPGMHWYHLDAGLSCGKSTGSTPDDSDLHACSSIPSPSLCLLLLAYPHQKLIAQLGHKQYCVRTSQPSHRTQSPLAPEPPSNYYTSRGATPV